jgi:hypothetical protein
MGRCSRQRDAEATPTASRLPWHFRRQVPPLNTQVSESFGQYTTRRAGEHLMDGLDTQTAERFVPRTWPKTRRSSASR